MEHFFADLLRLPEGRFPKQGRRSSLGNALILQGVIFNVVGLTILLVPTIPALLGAIPDPPPKEEGPEQGFLRYLGFLVFAVGLFYDVQGFGESEYFAAVSILARVIVVPPAIALLVRRFGLPMQLSLSMVALDWATALLTFVVYSLQTGSKMLFADVLRLPSGRFHARLPRSQVAAVLTLQGLACGFGGLVMMLAPNTLRDGRILPELQPVEDGPEQAYFRTIGFSVFYIELFFIFSGIDDDEYFAVASVFVRLAFGLPAPLLLQQLSSLPVRFAVAASSFEVAASAVTLTFYNRQASHKPTLLPVA